MLGWDIAGIDTLSYRDWARQSLTAFASGPMPCLAWPAHSWGHGGGGGARSQAQAGLVELEQAEMNSGSQEMAGTHLIICFPGVP